MRAAPFSSPLPFFHYGAELVAVPDPIYKTL